MFIVVATEVSENFYKAPKCQIYLSSFDFNRVSSPRVNFEKQDHQTKGAHHLWCTPIYDSQFIW